MTDETKTLAPAGDPDEQTLEAAKNSADGVGTAKDHLEDLETELEKESPDKEVVKKKVGAFREHLEALESHTEKTFAGVVHLFKRKKEAEAQQEAPATPAADTSTASSTAHLNKGNGGAVTGNVPAKQPTQAETVVT